MLIGGQENFALFIANFSDHEKPSASFPPLILHPDGGINPIESDRRTKSSSTGNHNDSDQQSGDQAPKSTPFRHSNHSTPFTNLPFPSRGYGNNQILARESTKERVARASLSMAFIKRRYGRALDRRSSAKIGPYRSGEPLRLPRAPPRRSILPRHPPLRGRDQ
jgi:hypothetical protein